VIRVVQGEHKGETFDLIHYRTNWQGEGPLLGNPRTVEFARGMEYLIFLKKDKTGRYELVRGLDEETSVKEITLK
jgi:hypothetical protein